MRIVILSDIHSNLEALQAVMSDMGPVDQKWCLGDTIGYGPNPAECLDIIKTFDIVLCGNHERSYINIGYRRSMTKLASRALTHFELSQEDKEFIAALETRHIVSAEGWKINMAHGSFERDAVSSYVSTCLDRSIELTRYTGATIVAVGHTHHQFISDEKKLLPTEVELDLTHNYLINPGSVGQPRDDNSDAAYCILDIKRGGEVKVSLRRVAYDKEETSRKILAAGLNKKLAERILEGW